MSKPPVSVVITTLYQQPPLLERAINSCKLQGIDVEVIVAARCAPHNIDVIARHPGVDKAIWSKGGLHCDAINLGHRAASGFFRYTLADDDQLMLGALSRLLAVHATHPQPETMYTYGDVQLRDRVHITPEWVPGINAGHFRTSNGMLWHEAVFPACYFRHPPQFPYFYTGYDFVMQMERSGVRGFKVPVVTMEWIPRHGGITQRSARWRDQIRRWINGEGGKSLLEERL